MLGSSTARPFRRTVRSSSCKVFAPAKVNLALHITGQRTDGYHLIDSLVVFVDVGDWVTVGPGQGLTIGGPEALPVTPDNLCLRAADGAQVAIHLDKHLPVSSGIGGGSADAAAVLRALDRQPADRGLSLGADVPMCLDGRPLRAQSVGEALTPVAVPPLWLVLANPRRAVSTPKVFGALTHRVNPPLPDVRRWSDAADLAIWLDATRNDMQAAAETLVPQIAGLCADLRRAEGCLLARMSGSGATCFGIFASERAAQSAADQLRAAERWVAVGASLAGPPPVEPV